MEYRPLANAAFLGVHFDGAPLLARDPLHVTEKALAACQRRLSIVRQIAEPTASFFNCLMLRLPSIPCCAIVVRLHQNPEKCVLAQPRRLFFAECSEF